MKIQRIATGLTVVNLLLLIFLLNQTYRARADDVAPVLRGRALQILDNQDRIRAEIVVHGPETVNGQTYPDTVLFRMATPQRAPLMKLVVSEKGSAFGLSEASSAGRVELRANREKGSEVRVISREGREQVLKPE
jgi:hypothetical protein